MTGGLRAALAGLALLAAAGATTLAGYWLGQEDTAFADGAATRMTPAEIKAAKGVTEEIPLKGGQILLSLTQGYAFIPAKEVPARLKSLGAAPPPGEVLGGVALSGADATWAFTIGYEEIGRVPERGADRIGSIAFFGEVQAARAAQGKSLTGFAVTPAYDQKGKALTWAETESAADLRYEQRLLGRFGAAGLTGAGRTSDLETLRKQAPKVLAMLAFTEGSRYQDFDPSADRVSAYDLPGLIAGQRKAGPAAAPAPVIDAEASPGARPALKQRAAASPSGILSSDALAPWFQWLAFAMVAAACLPYVSFNRELRDAL